MFLVRDTREERTKQIRKLMELDPVIAVIMAAADFEWTCRRCVLALGKSPTKHIREKVLHKASFAKYTGAWEKEVYPMWGKHIGEIIGESFFDNATNEAFILRNKLVHGEFGTVTDGYGREQVEKLLDASVKLTAFAADTCGEPIYGRRIIRIKPRPPKA